MKIRTDFVTNSSSSSFIVISKVDDCQELRDYMKEEYGKYGARLMDKYLRTGEDINEELTSVDSISSGSGNYVDREELGDDIVLKNDESYLVSSFMSESHEGDVEEDEAWLHNHIPSEYIDKIYEEEVW